ncbi:mannitol-1-phosphate 5-dehydrogenase [Brevibacillus sp. B_LB10_24]|uniref:mannitol-1-phosphate 5-dehydrogenase n=1 Tax=Brevibacillus sp. B_LB10_24 TaxID=3380645 RepID=UPI0038BCC154
MKKAVHFGAGSIGRGFIGDLLHDSGYEITFIEVSPVLLEQINQTHSYDLYLIDRNYEKKVIDNVSAVSPVVDEEKAIQAIVEGSILTTSVWADNLQHIAPTIAKGLKRRLRANGQKINVLACENALFATDMLKHDLLHCGVDIAEEELERIACFPNTAVDRMVFDVTVDGKRAVEIGSEHELVIEKNKLADPAEEPIQGAVYTDNLQKFLERKLYITNCSHAIAAYLGYLKGYAYLQEALADEDIHRQVLAAIGESAEMLSLKYGFSREELQDYIRFVIGRFMTPGVKDPITRVARSPVRKLDPSDRLAGPATACEKLGVENKYLCRGIAAALLFENPEDRQAVEMQTYIENRGIEQAIQHYTKIGPDAKSYAQIITSYNELSSSKQK